MAKVAFRAAFVNIERTIAIKAIALDFLFVYYAKAYPAKTVISS